MRSLPTRKKCQVTTRKSVRLGWEDMNYSVSTVFFPRPKGSIRRML